MVSTGGGSGGVGWYLQLTVPTVGWYWYGVVIRVLFSVWFCSGVCCCLWLPLFVASRVCDDGGSDSNSGFVLVLVGPVVVNITCFLYSFLHRIIPIIQNIMIRQMVTSIAMIIMTIVYFMPIEFMVIHVKVPIPSIIK